ncbi:hypothetical protein PTTG_12322 [Puccinia triticina 1-1 BBBD Race 1]|uniref:Uncharacterized protein n=1 Tax=Puccinia triticina (isolate 1-1 / race 1 (BBBD)) TaxID=630390 RepID=A0A180G7A0_PUCT1|nr:hypothetical protein PTTG_12322 [Puccinia triticina 1-1 BBBD Race 1]
MAIFQTAGKLPALTDADRASARGDSCLMGIVEALHELISQNPRFEKEEDFNREVAKLIPMAYQLKIDPFPAVDAWVASCEWEYQVVTQLIEVCQEMGPSMVAHGPLFWGQLRRIATQEKLEPFLGAYQQLCEFFAKGVPFNRLFDYYTLVSKICSSLKTFGESHDLTRSSSVSGAQSQSAKKEEMVFTQEIETSVLKQKANLLMNYAEELHQAASLGPATFHPNVRAEKKQIERIALLVLDVLSIDSSFDTDELYHQLRADVFRSGLPGVIKYNLHRITEFLRDEITEIIKLTDLSSEPVKEQGVMRRWDLHLSAAMKEGMKVNAPLKKQLEYAGKRFDLSQKSTNKENPEEHNELDRLEYNRLVRLAILNYKNSHVHVSATLRLDQYPIIWQAMLRTTDREFATIDKRNAEVLIKCLTRTKRIVRNIPVFDRIYYALYQVNAKCRNDILESAKARLDELKGKIRWEEHGLMMQIYYRIISAEKMITYEDWRGLFIPIIPTSPSHTLETIDDIFGDCSRSVLLKKLDKPRREFLEKNVYAFLRRDLLSQDLISQIDDKDFLDESFLRLEQEHAGTKGSSDRLGLLSTTIIQAPQAARGGKPPAVLRISNSSAKPAEVRWVRYSLNPQQQIAVAKVSK